MPPTFRTCTQPGCPELTTSGRCARHRDQGRATAAVRGYNHAWAKTRAGFLKRFPYCQHPGCGALATDVHHIDGLGPRGPQGSDWGNLAGLCHHHHSILTSREQPGGYDTKPRPRTLR